MMVIDIVIYIITLLVVSSEILIWRAFFAMDKKVSLGFMKMKNELKSLENNLNNKLENIEKLIKTKK